MTHPQDVAKKLEESDLTDPHTAVFGYIYAANRQDLQETLDGLDLRIRNYGDSDSPVVANRSLATAEQPVLLQIKKSYRGRDQFQVAVRWRGDAPEFSEDFLDTVNKAVESSKARNPEKARKAAFDNLLRSSSSPAMRKLLNKAEARGAVEDPLNKYFD